MHAIQAIRVIGSHTEPVEMALLYARCRRTLDDARRMDLL